MSLRFGQAIEPVTLEKITSGWTAERFTSMCSSLAWAISGPPPLSFQTTGRIYAADGGIDTELIFPVDTVLPLGAYYSPGRNVLQFKKRDVFAQGRKSVISELKSSLNGAFKEIAEGKDIPSRYILFVNVDLTGNESVALKESILSDFARPESVQVDILGAGELAAILNDYPHLRAAYFVPDLFKTWETANEDHKNQKLFSSSVELIGREKELAQLKTLIADQNTKIIAVRGPHDIGKTRLILEATRKWKHQTVIAMDPRSMKIGELRSLAPQRENENIFCIIEDPDIDSIDRIVQETLSISNLKVILAVHSVTEIARPSYGLDPRLEILKIEPLSVDSSWKLIRKSGVPLPRKTEEWIVQNAEGFPGIILAAAAFGHEIQMTHESISKQIGRQLYNKLKKEVDKKSFAVASLLSLLTFVGVFDKAKSELETICSLFDKNILPEEIQPALEELELSGIIRKGGDFVELVPPILADYLFSLKVTGKQNILLALFGKLGDKGVTRLIQRICSTSYKEESGQFLDLLFDGDGPFKDFSSTLENMQWLKEIVSVKPEKTINILERGLETKSHQDLRDIGGETRRHLVWTLGRLLYMPVAISKRALNLLWQLAVAENEPYSNSATGIVKSFFYPHHPYSPLPLCDRIQFLKEKSGPGRLAEANALAIKAMDSIFTFYRLLFPVEYSGLDIFPLVSIDYHDLREYYIASIKILFDLAECEEPVSIGALRLLPEFIFRFGQYGVTDRTYTEKAYEFFKILVGWAIEEKKGVVISNLADSIFQLSHQLSQLKFRGNLSLTAEKIKEFDLMSDRMKSLKNRLDDSSYPISLKRRLGTTNYAYFPGDFLPEIDLLAKKAEEKPELLSPALLEWLASPSAEYAPHFFESLGKADLSLKCLDKISIIGKGNDAYHAISFGFYFKGWGDRDLDAAEKTLDQWSESRKVSGLPLLYASSLLKPNEQGVNRVLKLMKDGEITSAEIKNVLMGREWLEKMTPEQMEAMVLLITGENMIFGVEDSIVILYWWVQVRGSLDENLSDFALKCFEHGLVSRNDTESWYFDQLASKIAEADLEKGFRLFEELLFKVGDETPSEDRPWSPLDRYESRQFCKTLYSNDKTRFIKTLIGVSGTDILRGIQAKYLLRIILDQKNDFGLILTIAGESLENARVIGESITSAKPCFWDLAEKLLETYPNDMVLQQNLVGAMEQVGGVITGSPDEFYETRKKEVDTVLQKQTLPAGFQRWILDIKSRLDKRVSSKLVWDYDIGVHDLIDHAKDKGSPQRIWAIGRILKYASWEEIRKLLSVEEIAETLPQVDIPDNKRQMLETALEVWLHEK